LIGLVQWSVPRSWQCNWPLTDALILPVITGETLMSYFKITGTWDQYRGSSFSLSSGGMLEYIHVTTHRHGISWRLTSRYKHRCPQFQMACRDGFSRTKAIIVKWSILRQFPCKLCSYSGNLQLSKLGRIVYHL